MNEQKLTGRISLQTITKEMAMIPGGEITLRDDRLQRKWTVELSPFLLGKYPVTQEFYFAITGEAPSTFAGNTHPVETITWKEAVIFCNSLSNRLGLTPCYSFPTAEEITFDAKAAGFRLPTEAEWEYACKAGTVQPRYGEIGEIAWYKENSGGKTHPVGTKKPNDWGLYDMLGNVWEWCSDVYDQTVYGSYRIIRGGGWNDEERGCLATNRRRSHPSSFRIDDLGCRIARNRE